MANYTVTNLTWTPAHAVFQPATDYKATVVLTANAGYRFVPLTPGTNVGTASAGTVNNNNEGNTLTFDVTFARTDPTNITSVSLGGFVAPVTGAAPITKDDLVIIA